MRYKNRHTIVTAILLCFLVSNLAQSESLLEDWQLDDVGFGVKPSFDFALDGSIHVMGMTEVFEGIAWHAVANSPAGPWDPRVVSVGYFYGPGDIRVDENGSAHIAFHDHDAQNAKHVEVSPNFVVQTRVADTFNTHDGWDNSLAFNSAGQLFQASVHPSSFGAIHSLVISRLENDTWISETITESDSFMYGFNTSIAFDQNDDPHVLYTAAQDWTEIGDLRHAFRQNGAWQVETVATDGIRGRFPTLAFDRSNRAHAAWLDIDEDDVAVGIVRYAVLEDGQWRESTVTELENVSLGFSGGRKQVSLALDNRGNPRIASGDMRVVNYSTLVNGSWNTESILEEADDRYNGLVVLRTNPITNDPAIVLWEPHDTEAGLVRLLSRSVQNIPGDVNSDGELDDADIDLIAEHLVGPQDLNFDVNASGAVDIDDYNFWLTDLKNVYRGDANLDGQFDSTDLVLVFQAGKFEDGQNLNAGWAEGDWNGDRDFDSSDFVAAFIEGGYDRGPKPPIVPEPNFVPPLCFGLWTIGLRLRRFKRDRSMF